MSEDSLFGWIMRGVYSLALLALIASAITSLFASETIQVGHGKLVHGWRMFGFKRERVYQLRDIFGLTSLFDSEEDAKKRKTLISPITDLGKRGLVRFEVGTRTVYIGPTLTEEEADIVRDWLMRRLPRSAVSD